jgi:toxin ParE1/3/4
MKIAYTPRAASNLRSLQDYIAVHDPAAAFRILQLIRKRIEGLAVQPRSGRPGRIGGTRELVITGSPYIAAYRVTDHRIEVLAVLHGAQRWPDRL